jgi:hypothetical protein
MAKDKKTYDEARSKFLRDYVPESADGSPIPQKYLDYADQEGKEAVEKSKKGKKAGGTVKMKSGGYVKAADGIATKGKTKGRFV